MPRKSEIMQMDLQREFSATMSVLRDIWDEIGMPDDQIEIRGSTVRMHIRNLLAGMVDEETQLKESMLESIKNYKVEISELCHRLSLPPFTLDESEMTVMQREKASRMQLNNLKQEKSQRMNDLKQLEAVEQVLCDQLCSIPYYIPSNTIPSKKQLEELQEHILSLKEEKQKRREEFKSKKSDIICLYDELELLPETSFAQDLIKEMEDSFSLSTSSMANITSLHHELSKRRHDRQLIVDGLWSQIHFLWDRLDIDEIERKTIRDKYRGLKVHIVDGLRKVLHDLELLKQANMQKLTERCRSDIATLWNNCFYSKEQRHQFSPAYDEDYTEELLNQHEEELARLHGYYEEHKVMFTDVRKWQSLFNRMLELESKGADVNRYANRGGNLLQEEKERKRICKQLPKIENELFQEIDKWEASKGVKFLIEGTEFRDYVHNQWEAFDARKENEKLQRQERKRQEMESEMTYGSAPKTPTKRRFIGTTTVLKTPDGKKSKKAMDCTSRSVLTANRFNINKAATSCLSPTGKPPIARNPSSVTPKKRLPFHKKPVKGTDSLSIKSAPPSVQKSGSLSTTIVSHVTTSSANSAPLHDADPSHYRDFADDINNQVRQNRLVRSSAIHDVKGL